MLRLVRAIWLGTGGVVAIIVVSTLWVSQQYRDQALEAARQNTANIARTLDQSSARAVDAADMLMRGVATHFDEERGPDRSSSLWGMVSDLTTNWRHVAAVTVLDTNTGKELFQYSSSYPTMRSIDEEGFAASGATRDRAIKITQPVYNAALNQWVIGVSRRIAIRSEPYDLVIVTHIAIDFFHDLFRRLEIGSEGSIVLFRNDGLMLARRPYLPGTVGVSVAKASLFREQLPKASHGTYEAASATDGIVRIMSYRQLEGMPLIILTGLSKNEVLARWRAQMGNIAVLMALAIAVILALSSWLTSIVRRRGHVEATLKATLEHMDQGLVMIDEKGVIQVHNSRASELLDLPKDLLPSKPLMEEVRQYQLDHGEFSNASDGLRTWATSVALRGYDVYERERPNGTVLEIRTVPLPDGGAVRTYTDVTARRKAERTVQQSEARYRILAENTGDMIVRTAPDGTRRYLSPATREMLGFEPEELVGTQAVHFTHPEDVEGLRLKMDALRRGELDRATNTHRFLHRDGHWIWVESNLRLTRDAEGRPHEIIAIMRDVTERQRHERELRAAKDLAEQALVRAEQANEAKSNFLATMSHEIRTPLNSIIGFTNILLERAELSGGDRRQLQLVQSSGSALLTVVNDVLDFSKIEAGQIEFDPHVFSLPAMIDDTVSIVQGAAAQKDVEISVSVPSALPHTFVGDSDRLRQILLNFLNNAVKFTRKGYVGLAVEHQGATEAGERLRISVTDTGIGIPKDKQGRLFQRFSQVDSSIRREFGGTGLGLAISKRLVELMQGEIGFESEEGVGSTFWFSVTLPRGEAPEELGRLERHTEHPASQSAKILLVEDLDINQELAQLILSRAGHQVDIANDGAEAVQAVQRSRYDMVLMDIQMPVMDGMTATARIRELGGPVQHIPIIAMTANVLPEQIAKFKDIGMNDHVGKPFRADELLGAVERWLPDLVIQDASKAEGGPALDRAAYDELIDLIGEDRVQALLGRLEKLLVAHLHAAPRDDRHRGQIATEAHSLISVAGMLGFMSLSDASRDLEQACLTNGAIEGLYARNQDFCRAALAHIAKIKTTSKAA